MNLIQDAGKRLELTEIFAVSLAVSLPWSTSATSVLVVLWLLAFILTCDVACLRRIISTPAGGLPLLLVAFGALGMLWADVGWTDRFNGMSSFLKLLFVPLFMCQFMRSDRSHYVLIGYLASCMLLLVASWVIFVWPGLIFHCNPKRPVFQLKTTFRKAPCSRFAL